MAEKDCGCQIGVRNTGMEATYGMRYCPMHQAATNMYEALNDIEQAAEWGLEGEDARARLDKIKDIAQDAIRKAEPKP